MMETNNVIILPIGNQKQLAVEPCRHLHTRNNYCVSCGAYVPRKHELYDDLIVAEHECCCYCGDKKRHSVCCSENHFELYYEYEDGEYYRADEVTIIPGAPLSDEDLVALHYENQYALMAEDLSALDSKKETK